MNKDFNPAQPIYYQLMQKICQQIVRGDLNAGDKLPSVREMALQYKLNPNTIQRAYNELERIWIAETKRGLGTFVTEDAGRLKRVREQLKEERIKSFIKRYG